MNTLSKKNKLFIVITLAVLVVGLALFGIFGFNQTIDHRKGYEVKVSVDQDAGNSLSILESATEEFFANNGLKNVEFATQKADDNKTIIYKFNTDVKVDEVKLAQYLNDKLIADESVKDVTATAIYSEVIGYNEFNVGGLLFGALVGLALAFIYALIMEKLSGAVAMIGSSILSALVFVALMGLVRIPAYPALGASISVALILSALLSITTVSRFNRAFKANVNSKPNADEIAEKLIKTECKKYIYTAIAVLVGSIAISAFFVPYMLFAGLQILLAGLVALTVSYFVTPLVWATVKGAKKK